MNEERVVARRGRFSDRERRGMGESIRGTNDEMFEGELFVESSWRCYRQGRRVDGRGGFAEIGGGNIDLRRRLTPIGLDFDSNSNLISSRFFDCVLHQTQVSPFDPFFLEPVGYHQNEFSLIEGHGFRAAEGGSPNGVTHLGPDAGSTVGPQTVRIPKIPHALHSPSTAPSTGVDSAFQNIV